MQCANARKRACASLADGSTRRRESKRHPKGHARDPIGLAELRAKFDDCTGHQQRALFERLLHLDAQPSVAVSSDTREHPPSASTWPLSSSRIRAL